MLIPSWLKGTKPMEMNNEEKGAIKARIITSIIFGFSFIFSKEALEYTTPTEILSYRFLIAAIMLYFLKRWKVLRININLKSISDLKPLLILSLFQPVAGYSFEMEGVSRLTAAESGIILSITPIVVTVIGNWYIKETPNKKQLLFIILSFVGILLILILKDSCFQNVNFAGSILLIAAAFCVAVYTLLSRKMSGKFTYGEITYAMMVGGALFFNGIHLTKCIVTGSFSTYLEAIHNPSIWVPALYLGVASSVIGFLLTNFSLARLTAFRVAIFNNLATVISIIAGIFIRKDPFTLMQAVGMFMIILGVWGVNYYSSKTDAG